MHWDQFRAGVYKRVAYGCANAAGIRPDIAHAADVRHWQRGAKASPPTNRQTNNAPHACASVEASSSKDAREYKIAHGSTSVVYKESDAPADPCAQMGHDNWLELSLQVRSISPVCR